MLLRLIGFVFLSLSVSLAIAAEPPAPWPPTIARKLPPPAKSLSDEVRHSLRMWHNGQTARISHSAEPDVAFLLKAVNYALLHDEFFDAKNDAAKAAMLLTLADERLGDLAKSQTPWTVQRGNVVRGYRSKLDGSPQPYGLVIPEKLDLSKPVPLYVWLHGRGDTKCDLQFIAGFLGPKLVGPLLVPDAIVLHPFGRYCNGWKSAGEVDVLEAIDDVKKKYKIDENRIVLAGFSMGGAGAWHLGAHYADRWCAVHAGAGFVDVKRYQNVTAENMPPWYEQKLWGLYDVPDYRRNLLNVPVLAYSGEEDKQKAAADIMEAELAAEGYQIPHLIGPKMGHKYHPDALVEIHERLAAIVAKGRDPYPTKVKLQTKTLRYNKMFWVEALGLKQHWEDGRIDAEITGPESISITTKNITALKLTNPWGPDTKITPEFTITIDGQAVSPRESVVEPSPQGRAEVFLPPMPVTQLQPKLSPSIAPQRLSFEGKEYRIIDPPVAPQGPHQSQVLGRLVELPAAKEVSSNPAGELYLVKRSRGWVAERQLPYDYSPYRIRRKGPGLQGPIDDVFMEPFSVTQPTEGSPNSPVDRWVNFERQHFVDRWRMLMRGEAVAQPFSNIDANYDRNVVLWGTPTTNQHIRAILDRLPIVWDEGIVGIGDLRFDATKVVPMLIYPNPHNPARYVVINGGLTFREAHDRTNSLQNPKLGDWAFVDVTEPPTDEAPGKVLASGFFDEEWEYVKK